MAGIWTDQNKTMPGAYINFKTNSPISISMIDRGIVVILQHMEEGEKGTMYKVTPGENNFPEGADDSLAKEALKGANTVYVYCLNNADEHDTEDITAALTALKTLSFNVLVYPYTDSENTTVAAWVGQMRDEEGIKVQAVIPNYVADKEYIINPVQQIVLEGNKTLELGAVAAYVGGITAGANINESNTNKKYVGAIDVKPRMTKSEMEAAIKAGKYIFKVDNAQNVTSVYDINSLTTISPEKNKSFTKNRTIRTIDSINNDIVTIFESNYLGGKTSNTEDGRSLLKSTLIEYFKELERMNAIQNFDEEKDVEVLEGNEKDTVVINTNIQTVDSIEKMFITVNLS